MKKIIFFLNELLNFIFPNVCGICDKICKDNLCKKCELRLKEESKVKIDIYKNKSFKKHLYLFKYDGIIKQRLIKFKFREKAYIYKAFVNFIIKNKKVCSFLLSYDIIIPVPIHFYRRVVRGYNQSALISKAIAKHLNINHEEKVLYKKTNNKPQSTKNAKERKENVLGVYYIKNSYKIKNKKIILLDDIYTTGSTVNECATILKKAGAKKVDIITIAKD